jgi:hypothetical protein
MIKLSIPIIIVLSVKMEHPLKIMHIEMEHLSSDMEQQNLHQQQLQWRRDKVQELCSK